jgi:YYY domain-containing protein
MQETSMNSLGGVLPPAAGSSRAQPRTRLLAVSRSDALAALLMVAFMLIGGYFRYVGINWDDFTHLHPDERFLTDVAQGLGRNLNPSGGELERQQQISTCIERYPDSGGMGPYFDAYCSTLNPHNANAGHGMYVYGTLPLFAARGSAEILVSVSEWVAHSILAPLTGEARWAEYVGAPWRQYDGVHLVWRFLSAASEMGVIVAAFLIGRKLHGRWVGILAAGIYTGTVFSIQLAHFGTTDAMSNLFAALSILAAVYVQREGRLRDYLFFGVVFGAAIASRINLAFLVGLLGLATIVQLLPILDRHLAPGVRERMLARHILGVVIAAVATIVVFRLTNPYAFMGPGVFGLSLNPRWLQDLATAQTLVRGDADSPPNFQWVARTPYLFPFQNMVLWGMGIAFGAAGWIAFAFALWRIIRGKPGALLNLILVAWVAVYFGYMGRQWVTTMRYFIPIYPALAVLAAWGMVALIRSGRRRLAESNGRHGAWRVRFGWLAAVGVVGFTMLWAAMFTNIYRNMLTRVQAGHWVWENVPGDFAMRIDGADERVPLMQIPIPNNFATRASNEDLVNRLTRWDTTLGMNSYNERFVAPADGVVSMIHAPHLGDPLDDPDNEVLRIEIRTGDDTQVLATAMIDQNLTRTTSIAGDPLDIPLDAPFEVTAGTEYRFYIELVSGGPVVSGGTIFTWEGAWDDPVPTKVCTLPLGVTLADNPPPGLIHDSRDCNGRDPWWGLVTGYEQNIVYADDEAKRERLLLTLNNSDYIGISSNRFYDTLSRNPLRWPLTNAYYDWLFSGELGYELVAVFQETFELGPLRISDQHLPIYDSPEWLNEFESEEAFSVYDHPVVFIFRRGDDYDPDYVESLLYSVPITRVYDAPLYRNCPENPELYYCDPTLVGVHDLSSEQADRAPTQLMLTSEMAEIQYSGGTWSDRFHIDSIVNTNQIASVVIWWLVIMMFGWVTFPLLFAVLPGLADRGYSFAKFTGMFLAGWGTWYLASVRIPVWSQVGIAGAMLVILALGVFLVRRSPDSFAGWVRRHWKRLLAIEGITLAAFCLMLFIRLTNPDLWVTGFGGEKPMDVAYFNAVLRSTIFPPYDPWYAGGYINYYYFGYVIVGAPVLLLGMVSSIAYNLILPTLFAATGIGAFSIAFTIVSALREKLNKPDDPASPEDGQASQPARWRRLGNPWVAGIAALMLAVVMGNLDTPRVALTGLANLGGYTRPEGLEQFLVQEYALETGETPSESTRLELMMRASEGHLGDRLRYELDNAADIVASVARGIVAVINGQQLHISADRWFWAPSRVYAETPGVEGGAITEMPMFTFIYGDLHAHMISMPMQLFAAAFLLSEILLAGGDKRRRDARFFALLIGAATVGLLRATNTWDWITYMLLGVAGLGFAWWLAHRRINRRSLISLGLYAGGFVVLTFITCLPFTTWFGTGYSSVRPWTDGKSPIWAFLDIHGLFLFLVTSLLVWDTGRWFRSVRVRSLRGTAGLLLAGAIIIVSLLAASVVLAMLSYQVTLIVLPLLVWTAILFFRANQTRVMQYALALFGLGLGLTLGVEYIVLDGDIGRQNTVFKFYMQVWLLWSVVGGVAFALLWRASERWRASMRVPWTMVLVLLVAVASLFPVMATRGKAEYRFDREQPLTLDGIEFMNYATLWEGDPRRVAADPSLAPFTLAEDFEMIRWLQDNVQGTPTIIEGLGSDTQYRWNGRISIYTGLPAVLGWNFHQRQQRTFDPMGRMVEMRNANVHAFYETTNIGVAWRMLRHYDVTYIIVGLYERAHYGTEGLAKFEDMVEMGLLDVAFRTEGSVIYQVNRDAAPLELVAQQQG